MVVDIPSSTAMLAVKGKVVLTTAVTEFEVSGEL
jgi:hypothetical protein